MTKITFDINERQSVEMNSNIRLNSNELIEILDDNIEYQQGVKLKQSTDGFTQVGVSFIDNINSEIMLEVELSNQDKRALYEQGLNPDDTDIVCNINAILEGDLITLFNSQDFGEVESESIIDKESINIIEFIDISLYDRKSMIELDETLYEDDVELAKTMLRDFVKDVSIYSIKNEVEIIE